MLKFKIKSLWWILIKVSLCIFINISTVSVKTVSLISSVNNCIQCVLSSVIALKSKVFYTQAGWRTTFKAVHAFAT